VNKLDCDDLILLTWSPVAISIVCKDYSIRGQFFNPIVQWQSFGSHGFILGSVKQALAVPNPIYVRFFMGSLF